MISNSVSNKTGFLENTMNKMFIFKENYSLDELTSKLYQLEIKKEIFKLFKSIY